MARIALASTRATLEHIGVFDEQPLIMAAVSDPDVMGHIRYSVLGGLDSMPEDERAVLLETLENLARRRRLLRGSGRRALLPSQYGPPPPTPARSRNRTGDCAPHGTSPTSVSHSPLSASRNSPGSRRCVWRSGVATARRPLLSVKTLVSADL